MKSRIMIILKNTEIKIFNKVTQVSENVNFFPFFAYKLLHN